MNQEIFLQISSWRDRSTILTIMSALENAYDRTKIKIGCVFQGYKEDMYIAKELLQIPEVSLIVIDCEVAPISLCKIRGEIGCSLLKDEEFYMQIDAHTKFVKNWDILLKTELILAEKFISNPVITGMMNYGFSDWNDNFNLETTDANHVRADELLFKKYGAATVGRPILKKSNTIMLEKMYFGALVFSRSSYPKEITQPSILGGCQYEQPLMSLRTFTGGYNLISATKCYTSNYTSEDQEIYRRQNDKKWKNRWHLAEQDSKILFKNILQNNIINNEYGLFEKRTLQEYKDFAGFDPLTLKVFNDQNDIYKDNNFYTISDIDFELTKLSLM